MRYYSKLIYYCMKSSNIFYVQQIREYNCFIAKPVTIISSDAKLMGFLEVSCPGMEKVNNRVITTIRMQQRAT